MTDTIALEIAIKKKGLTKKAVANALNLSECGFLSKLNNKTEFKQSEIDMLCALLDWLYQQNGELVYLVYRYMYTK